MYNIFGLKADEIDLHYQQFLNFLAPQDLDRIHALVDEAIGERRHFSCDYRITLADGSIRVLHDRGGPILNGEGAPIGRSLGDVTFKAFRCAEAGLIHNILRAAGVAGLDGDELGSTLDRVAKIRTMD